jgi:hypothetical protein
MTKRVLLLSVSVISLNAGLLSSGWAATCVTDVTATTGNVNSVTGQTSAAAVTAVTPTFGDALTSVQTTATQGSFLTGATLATTSGNAVTNVTATTTPVPSFNNPQLFNVAATTPPGFFFNPGFGNNVQVTNPPGVINVEVFSGDPTTLNLVTAINAPTAPFLTGTTLRTTAGNALQGSKRHRPMLHSSMQFGFRVGTS